MKKIIILSGIMLTVIVTSFFIISSLVIKPDDPSYSEDKKIVIGLSMASFEVERWITDRDYFVQEAQSLGAEVEVMSANGDPELQIKQCETLINRGADVLVVVPRDAKTAAKIIEIAHNHGVKVISYDRLIKNSDVDYYITFDNTKVGELQAQSILEKIPAGKYAYIGGSPTDNNAFMFKNGTMNIIQPEIDNGNIELVLENFTTDWMTDIAYRTMKNFLDNGGKIDAVIAANDGTATGVINALKEYNLAGKVAVSGQDASLAGLHHIIAGEQTMTVYKPIDVLAKKAAKLAISVAKGEEIQTNSKIDNGKIDVPSILLDVVAVNVNNINSTVIKDGFHTYNEVYTIE